MMLVRFVNNITESYPQTVHGSNNTFSLQLSLK